MRAQEAKIAVFGAGAMGTVLGALLTKGGLEVDLITRNGGHVTGLREKGALLDCTAENKEIVQPVKALFPAEMGEYDVIFLMTKQRHNEEILQGLLPHLKKEGVVCTTQNGLPEGSVAAVIGKERTYGAATSFGATFVGEGRVELTSKFEGMRMEIGGLAEREDKLALLEEILSFAGKAIEKKEDFVKRTELLPARWAKLTINAAFSGLSVVTGLTFGEVAKRRKSRKIALGILRECMAVANAQGIRLAKMQGHDMEKMLGGKTPFERFVAYMVLPFAMKKHKKLTSGMLYDLLAGRKCEIDFVNGVVVKEGEKAGVDTPLCKKVVEIVHGIENGLYEIDYKNIDFF